MDTGKVIGMKQAGMSTRQINRETGYDRQKIGRIWNRYRSLEEELGKTGRDIRKIVEEMFEEPKYDVSKRKKRKYTEEIARRLEAILEEEEKKKRRLGKGHKQKLTNRDIHEKLREEGYDISRATINAAIAKQRSKIGEVYIRQQYDYGDRLEYDFGEVMLNCGEGVKTYHMAVLSSPASNFRWAYLYTNQKQAVFLDSHVKFFEMTGGAWKEVVYDNMKNVVQRFIGRNEKELNKELVQMAMYYGYSVNVTNCFKGNEKGHVENSVKTLRQQIFSKRDTFLNLEEAREYMESCLRRINEKSGIEEEKLHLLPKKPPLELAEVSENKVDSYSFIQTDYVNYSVPERLAGSRVIVKRYHDEIRVYSDGELVCSHERVFEAGENVVDIMHYLETLKRKPGAVRNSAALKSNHKLKALFDTYYADNPKKFIEILMDNKDLTKKALIELIEKKAVERAELQAIEVIGYAGQADVSARAAALKYQDLVFRGADPYGGNNDGVGGGVKATAYVYSR